MRILTLPLPEFGVVVATRAALGVGLGLLFADKLSPERRRVVGLSLVGFGAVTTIPAVKWILRGTRRQLATKGVNYDRALVGAERFPRKGNEEL